MNAFIHHLSNIVPLSIDAQIAINSITIHTKVPKNTLLLRNGDICKHFHFLGSGLARVFYYKDGKDITAWFAGANAIASAIDSLFTGKPSMYNIELLEESDIFSLHYAMLEPIFQAYPAVERVGRLLVTENYLLLDERMKMFAFCTAEERYDLLTTQFPNVMQRVKLGHIASYLGISQEHLSRIRGAVKKNYG